MSELPIEQNEQPEEELTIGQMAQRAQMAQSAKKQEVISEEEVTSKQHELNEKGEVVKKETGSDAADFKVDTDKISVGDVVTDKKEDVVEKKSETADAPAKEEAVAKKETTEKGKGK
jgi:plastocyanin